MTRELKAARRRTTAADEERRELMESMERTRAELNQAYAQFNSYSDPDLVDSCVYAINALRSRYSYFIRRMKMLDGQQGEAG